MWEFGESMVKIIDTTFRDAHQSLIATRLKTEDMIPIVEKMDSVGFYSMEMWGGATFDVSLRYLREDPWERLRTLREVINKTKLQMLLRGQNVVGYKHYPDDVVKKFVELAHKNGIDIFRIFDALNDIRNMDMAIKTAKEVGAEVQGAISYTTGKIFTEDYYLSLVEQFIERDVDYITIKDMAGLLTPPIAYNLVKKIKENYDIAVNVHTHSTSGMAVATYLKAVEAGADYIDTAISPLAFGTAQPGIQIINYSLPEKMRPTLNMDIIYELGDYLEQLIEDKYGHYLHTKALVVNPSVLRHQIPGGMFSNLLRQLKDMDAAEHLKDVLEEIPHVREDLGFPPLVTPTSQIVGTQAVLNVLFGRYKKITNETKNYIRGLYGRPPGKVNPELMKLAINDEKPITTRPADHLTPMLEDCKKELSSKGYSEVNEEDILSYCLFPNIAEEFFKLRKEGKLEPVNEKVELRGKIYRMYINGKVYEVGVEDLQ